MAGVDANLGQVSLGGGISFQADTSDITSELKPQSSVSFASSAGQPSDSKQSNVVGDVSGHAFYLIDLDDPTESSSSSTLTTSSVGVAAATIISGDPVVTPTNITAGIQPMLDDPYSASVSNNTQLQVLLKCYAGTKAC